MQDAVRTVLVIEDDDSLRPLLRTLLRLAGYEVLTCRDGAEALDLMDARGGRVQVLIADINLGGAMDGYEAAAGLRRRHPDLRVLFMSGFDSDAADGKESETERFLAKPFTPRELTAAVAALMPPLKAVAP